MSLWTDTLNFETRWSKIRRVGGGGQANGFEVRRIGEAGPSYFMKVLKAQTDRERRSRMFTEAAALSTYHHQRIPKFVESNAHRHEDLSHELFLVTEFIPGETLSALSPMSFNAALEVTAKLATVVGYLQERNAVHRDIKPDNVILRADTLEPVLVDFGMTFNADVLSRMETGEWQELGNRFLRLPELSPYSENKRDFRSDLAFLTGILFYCLVGRAPSVLQDEFGRMPHQVQDVNLTAIAPHNVEGLSAFFGRGFQPRVVDRFSNVGEFQKQLSRLKEPSEKVDIEVLVRNLREKYSSETIERQRRRAATLEAGWRTVMHALSVASKLTNDLYVPTSSGDYDPNTDAPYRNMGLHHHYRQHHMRYWLKVTCRFVGTEFIISAEDHVDGDEDTLVRTDAERPSFELFKTDQFISRLLRGVQALPEY